jgi:hypothetical protein
MTVWRSLILAVAVLGPSAGTGALSAAEQDADWPCVQRLVPEIAPGMIWTGPPPDSLEEGGGADPMLQHLAGELAARRVPLEQAQEQIDAFARGLPAGHKNERLTRLFAATLAIINRDRGSIIGGIRKYARGQQALAQRINARNEELSGLAADSATERDALMTEQNWDLRVYEDRRSSLGYLCEQPVLLEQRAFALARTIAGHLE